MPRILYGDISALAPVPIDYKSPKDKYADTGTPGYMRGIDKASTFLKLGEQFVDSDIGKGAMDLVGKGIGALGTAAEEASLVANTQRLQAAAKAAQAERDGIPEVDDSGERLAVPTAPLVTKPVLPRTTMDAPPVKMMPGNYGQQAMQELESKLGKEYAALSETATSSPDPRVVSAADKRMKAIEAQLDAMKIRQNPDEPLAGGGPDAGINEEYLRDVGIRRRSDDGFVPAAGERQYAERPPAGSRETANALARGMSAYTPKVEAADEQAALEAEMLDNQLRRGGSIDQILGRKPDVRDKRVEGGLAPGQAYQRVVQTYTKMLDDAVERGAPEAEIDRIDKLLKKAQDKLTETMMTATGTPQELLQQKQLRTRLQGLDPAAYGELGATSPTSPAGGPSGFVDLPGMTVQSVSNRPGGEPGVYYSEDYDGKVPTAPAAGTAAAPATAPVLPGNKAARADSFDLSEFNVEPKAAQDASGNWVVTRPRVPTENDVRAYAAAADTPAKRKQVFELADRMQTTPSSLFDFKDGGPKARLAKEVDKLFPAMAKPVDESLAQYRRDTVDLKKLNLENRKEVETARRKLMETKLTWDKEKFARWEQMMLARIKAAKKKGGSPGAALAAAKAALGVAEDQVAEIENTLKKADAAVETAEEAARKARQAAAAKAAGAGTVGEAPKVPDTSEDDPNTAEAKQKAYAAEQATYDKRKKDAEKDKAEAESIKVDAEKHEKEAKEKAAKLKNDTKDALERTKKGRDALRRQIGGV